MTTSGYWFPTDKRVKCPQSLDLVCPDAAELHTDSREAK